MRHIVTIVLATAGLAVFGPNGAVAIPAYAPGMSATEAVRSDVQVRTNCPKGYYIAEDGRCRRLHAGPECRPGYFMDYDGRCKRTRRNLRLAE